MKRRRGAASVAVVAMAAVGCESPAPTGPGTAVEAITTTAPTGLLLKPEVACALLADQGLAVAGGYEASGGGTFSCSSFKKILPVGDSAPDTLQFLAQGSQETVTRLKVELDLRSPGEVQAALRMLLAPVKVLIERVLGASVPEEAQVAIRSGVSGDWRVASATLTVARISTFTTQVVVTLH